MPFQSDAQRRFMYAQHPGIAKRWAKHTPKGENLPEKKTDSDPEETKALDEQEKKAFVKTIWQMQLGLIKNADIAAVVNKIKPILNKGIYLPRKIADIYGNASKGEMAGLMGGKLLGHYAGGHYLDSVIDEDAPQGDVKRLAAGLGLTTLGGVGGFYGAKGIEKLIKFLPK